MTPQDTLGELLARIGAKMGAPVMISEEELRGWPPTAVEAMRAHKLLVKASPAASAVCPGCEQECVMPVHTVNAVTASPQCFIVCDKRDDINRVRVPVIRLEQWQTTGIAVSKLLRALAGLRPMDSIDTCSGRWEVGVIKGKKGSGHLVLLAKGSLTLTLCGHSLPLIDVLTLDVSGFRLDRTRLIGLVDKPVGGAGDLESVTQRRARIRSLVQAEKDKGNRAFLKTVAEAEGVSVQRIKQLLELSRAKTAVGRRKARWARG